MEKVIYQGKKLGVGESENKGMVVLWQHLPDGPEPYAEISEEECAKLEKVIEDDRGL